MDKRVIALSAFAVALLAGICYAVSPSTQWGDVPPDSTLYSVGEQAGWNGGGGGVKRVAMFIVPINPTGPNANGGGVIWRGFELKASTNNFSSATPDSVKLQYFAVSHWGNGGSITNDGVVTTCDKMNMYYCSNLSGADFRAYVKLNNNSTASDGYGDAQFFKYIVAMVDTTCLRRNAEDNGRVWLTDSNANLSWRFILSSSGGVEQESYHGGGTAGEYWQPIEPARWFSELPDWAK